MQEEKRGKTILQLMRLTQTFLLADGDGETIVTITSVSAQRIPACAVFTHSLVLTFINI